MLIQQYENTSGDDTSMRAYQVVRNVSFSENICVCTWSMFSKAIIHWGPHVDHMPPYSNLKVKIFEIVLITPG